MKMNKKIYIQPTVELVACASATEIMEDLYMSIHDEEGSEQGAKGFNFDDEEDMSIIDRNLWDD